MLIPRRDFLDEVFDFEDFDPFFARKDNKLMKTDIREVDGNYVFEIDIPGYDKENIKIELDNGYLIVTAESNRSSEENEEGYIRRERVIGTCTRSYLVGKNVTEDQIKASFKNGILKLTFPKESPQQADNKRYIQIED